MINKTWSFILAIGLYVQTAQSQETDPTFVVCEHVRIWPYYHPDLTNKISFWDIKHHFEKDYPLSSFQKMKHNSGIITVKFWVNCHGEMGGFNVLECDLTYKETQLNVGISNYFLKKTKLLTQWEVPVNSHGTQVNSHKFYSFRIVNGKLIQILPK